MDIGSHYIGLITWIGFLCAYMGIYDYIYGTSSWKKWVCAKAQWVCANTEEDGDTIIF